METNGLCKSDSMFGSVGDGGWESTETFILTERRPKRHYIKAFYNGFQG